MAFTIDRGGRILEANEYTEKLTGLKAKDVIGKKFSEIGLLGKKDLIRAFLEFRKNLQGKVTEKTIYTIKLKGGRDLLLELIGIPIRENGRVTKVLDVGSDVTEREKTGEKLREREERYRFISESMRDIMLILDKTGRILFANKRAFEASGYAENEMVGKSIASFLTKNSIKTAFYVLTKEFLGQPQKKIELEIKTKSGEIRYLEVDEGSVPVREKGKTVGILVTGRDITERKKAEEKLRESEKRYRIQFEEALDAIVIADAKTGIIVNCNRAATELVGRSKAELIGQHQKILHPPEGIEGQFSETFRKHLTEARGQALETHVITKNGKLKDVTIKANLIETEGKKLLQGIFRDITEQKKVQNVIFENENTYRIAAEQTGQIIYDYDVASGRIKWLGAITSLTGYGFDEFQKMGIKEWGDAIHPDDRETALSLLEKALKEGTKYDAEYRFMRKDGNYIYMENSGTVLKNAEGKAFRMLGTMKDITERKKAGEEIIKRTEELEKINKLSVGRELKMVELKKRINELESQLKKNKTGS